MMFARRVKLEVHGVMMSVRLDNCTRNLLLDIPHMSTETLTLMRQNSKSRVVKAMVEAELTAREPIASQPVPAIAAPIEETVEVETYDDMTVDTHMDDHPALDDDFVPFGEDDRVPKHMWKRMRYSVR